MPIKRHIHKIFTQTLNINPHKIFNLFQDFAKNQEPSEKDTCLKTKGNLQVVAHNSENDFFFFFQNSKRSKFKRYQVLIIVILGIPYKIIYP